MELELKETKGKGSVTIVTGQTNGRGTKGYRDNPLTKKYERSMLDADNPSDIQAVELHDLFRMMYYEINGDISYVPDISRYSEKQIEAKLEQIVASRDKGEVLEEPTNKEITLEAGKEWVRDFLTHLADEDKKLIIHWPDFFEDQSRSNSEKYSREHLKRDLAEITQELEMERQTQIAYEPEVLHAVAQSINGSEGIRWPRNLPEEIDKNIYKTDNVDSLVSKLKTLKEDELDANQKEALSALEKLPKTIADVLTKIKELPAQAQSYVEEGNNVVLLRRGSYGHFTAVAESCDGKLVQKEERGSEGGLASFNLLAKLNPDAKLCFGFDKVGDFGSKGLTVHVPEKESLFSNLNLSEEKLVEKMSVSSRNMGMRR